MWCDHSSTLRSIVASALLAIVTSTAAIAADLVFSSDRTGRNQLWTVKTEDPGSTLKQVTTAGSGAQESRSPDWSAPQGRIAYQFGASGVRGIHAINPDGTGDLRLTLFPSDERDPSWSPDGKFIVYARLMGTGDYDLWIHRVDNLIPDFSLLFRPGSSEQRPAWSPDGKRIAFVASGGSVGPDAEIGVVDVKFDASTGTIVAVKDALGSPKTVQLTNNSFIDFDPAWSPDSKRIAYSSTRNGNRDIFRMSAEFGECNDPSDPAQTWACSSFVQLTTSPAEDRNPAWSPDGATIAFVSERDGNREIYLMSAIAGESDIDGLLRLTNTPAANNDDPAWLPVVPPPPTLSIDVSILPVPSGALFPTKGTVRVRNAFGEPIPGATVTILGPLGSPAIDKLYISPLGGITDTSGEFEFEAREETWLPSSTTAEFAFAISAIISGHPVTATVSKFVDVIGSGSPLPPTPPGPLPPPPDKVFPVGGNPWTPQQKLAFSQGGLKLTAQGTAYFLGGLLSDLPIPGGNPVSPFIVPNVFQLAVGFQMIAMGQALQVLAVDPPDPDYLTVAPVLPHIPKPILIADGFSAHTTRLMNDYQSSGALIEAHLRALRTSVDRYFTALSASDLRSAALQRNAILAYRSALMRLFQAHSVIAESLRVGLQADGFPGLQLTEADVVTIQLAVAASGLPSRTLEFLQQLGLSLAEIETVKSAVLSAVPAEVAGNSYDYLVADTLISKSAATTFNLSPVANVGPDRIVRLGTQVALVSVGSVDPDQGPNNLSYAWTQVFGPDVVLAGANTFSPTFTPAVAGSYAFSLTVSDGLADSLPSSVRIRVPILGDIDLDGDVDINDLNIVTATRNSIANSLNDLRDLNGDMKIDALDARMLVPLCTRPRCATK